MQLSKERHTTHCIDCVTSVCTDCSCCRLPAHLDMSKPRSVAAPIQGLPKPTRDTLRSFPGKGTDAASVGGGNLDVDAEALRPLPLLLRSRLADCDCVLHSCIGNDGTSHLWVALVLRKTARETRFAYMLAGKRVALRVELSHNGATYIDEVPHTPERFQFSPSPWRRDSRAVCPVYPFRNTPPPGMGDTQA